MGEYDLATVSYDSVNKVGVGWIARDGEGSPGVSFRADRVSAVGWVGGGWVGLGFPSSFLPSRSDHYWRFWWTFLITCQLLGRRWLFFGCSWIFFSWILFVWEFAILGILSSQKESCPFGSSQLLIYRSWKKSCSLLKRASGWWVTHLSNILYNFYLRASDDIRIYVIGELELRAFETWELFL